jgi:hypothetical protein
MAWHLLRIIRGYFKDYLNSYERGRRKYGALWTIFTVSLLLLIVILIAFALGLVIFVLPGLRAV